MTFTELAKWYLELEKVKALKSYWLVERCLKKFNREFGTRIVNTVKLADLENYQIRRLKEGMAPGTVDHEIGKARTMIIKAFENDMVGGDVLKVFTRCKRTLKPGSDIRDRILSRDEFETLLAKAPRHMRPILAAGYYTGMRRGEILGLTWDNVDLKGRAVRLTAHMTKDSEFRTIPICDALYDELKAIPRALHKSHVFFLSWKADYMYPDRFAEGLQKGWYCIRPVRGRRIHLSRSEAHLQHQHAKGRRWRIGDHGHHRPQYPGNVR